MEIVIDRRMTEDQIGDAPGCKGYARQIAWASPFLSMRHKGAHDQRLEEHRI